MKTSSRWQHGICAVLSAIFLYAGMLKMADPAAFADRVAAFQLLAWPRGITLLALGLPCLEILLSVLLWVGSWRRPALLGIFLLSVVFLSALISAWARGISTDCGCFGTSAVTAWSLPLAVLRASFLMAASGIAYGRLFTVGIANRAD